MRIAKLISFIIFPIIGIYLFIWSLIPQKLETGLIALITKPFQGRIFSSLSDSPTEESAMAMLSSPLRFRVTLKGEFIEIPERIAVDTAFVVGIQLKIINVDDISVPPAAESFLTKENIHNLFFYVAPPCKLSIAGMEVQPNEPISLSRDGRAWWTVKPIKEGKYVGIITLSETLNIEIADGIITDIEFENDGSLKFDIKVKSATITARTFISWIGKFLGPILTLPGLLAFIEALRKKLSKHKKNTKKKN